MAHRDASNWQKKKQDAILAEIKAVLRMKRGVPFGRFEKLLGRLCHAAIGIPARCNLFGPANQLLSWQPKRVFWDRSPAVEEMLRDWAQLIREASSEPTHVRELVAGEPAYVGTLDALGEGDGGVWLPGAKAVAPIV